MAVSKRSNCPISLSLELFGDRWTLLIMRDMILFDKRHFRDFAKQEGIATNILTTRLKRLVEHNILTKNKDPQNLSSNQYSLTKKGLSLIPIVIDILEWGYAHNKSSKPDLSFMQALVEDRERTLEELRKKLYILHDIDLQSTAI